MVSFVLWWRKRWGFALLAITTSLQYRINFISDMLIQPVMTVLIELALWSALFHGVHHGLIAGFPREAYFTYALWAVFLARISGNWMYQMRMIADIEFGSLNSLLVRPFSFSSYYLWQLMGYKVLTIAVSLVVPILATALVFDDFAWQRIPAALVLVLLYVVFSHYFSLWIATLALHLNRVQRIAVAKNLALWFFSGELFPLDLAPTWMREIVLTLPFSSGVYVPTAYLCQRIGWDGFFRGVLNTMIGIVVMAWLAETSFKRGLRVYSGTGA
jgi:ABC-2 type transport system permease protein